ncbi:2-oxo-4-hydroxy-4-carboxy-5-ureidoimidazoline decarboxylase [Salipaludibacillus sp. CF4.18]|uniref:2-oxo-4-hydroxy-4-carboxy-5-ureidoimidazoline decarboxylase n=1 Tax=Salipaludibacillus sp. CF4.18 TaxID=3373081 RepID=UPI003EE47B0E
MYTLSEVNKMGTSEFVTKIGSVFEHSPWVAEESVKHKPFADYNQLYSMMIDEMYQAHPSLQLSLLRAHPDLGTKLDISQSSKLEQRNAGLNNLSEQEYKEFSLLNETYVKKFEFPFIMAVKGQDKDRIQQKMKKRIENNPDQELEAALYEISKIVKFRLDDIVEAD